MWCCGSKNQVQAMSEKKAVVVVATPPWLPTPSKDGLPENRCMMPHILHRHVCDWMPLIPLAKDERLCATVMNVEESLNIHVTRWTDLNRLRTYARAQWAGLDKVSITYDTVHHSAYWLVTRGGSIYQLVHPLTQEECRALVPEQDGRKFSQTQWPAIAE